MQYPPLNLDAPTKVASNEARAKTRFIVALCTLIPLLLVAVGFAFAFHGDATSTHSRLRSSQHALSTTQSRLRTTVSDLRTAENTLDSTRTDLLAARAEASAAQTDAAHSEAVIDALSNVHDQVTACVNAWGDFINSSYIDPTYGVRLYDNTLAAQAVAVCNVAIDADNSLTNALNASASAI